MAEDRTTGYFSGLEAKHRRRVLVWGGIVLTLLAAALAYALLRLPAEDSPPPRKAPAPEATSTPEATSSPAPRPSSAGSDSVPGDLGGDSEPNERNEDAGASPAAIVGSGWTAYVLDGSVWVSQCDGSARKNVASTDSLLAYAVSPDGRTLALARSGGLELLDVASGKASAVTKGAAGGLSWSADSKRLAFSASAVSPAEWTVRVCGRDGTGLVTLGNGVMPRISPDGARVAFSASDGSAVTVAPVAGGKTATIAAAKGALDLAWAAADALYAILPGQAAPGQPPSTMAIRRATLSGKSEVVYSSAISAPIVTWMYLYASPDGQSLLFAEVGDDGYARAHVLGANRKVFDLSVRRDTTPVGWSRDGRVLFVEGNSFQGERTDLMCAKADATGRRLLTAGASR